MILSFWNDCLEFLKNFIPDITLYVLKLGLIIVAILVALEILKTFGILDFLNKILSVFTKPLGMSKGASMPMLVGLLAGLTYGAGAIIASYNSGEMNKKDVILVSVFLCIFHSALEDILLLVSVGANGWIMVLSRLILAIIATLIANLILNLKNKNNNEMKGEEKCVK